MTSVRSQDQRRMLQESSHNFPGMIQRMDPQNYKEEKSNKCDLCKALWIGEDRFTTEENLPKQDLGHIQHTCESLATAASHTEAHHSALTTALQTIWLRFGTNSVTTRNRGPTISTYQSQSMRNGMQQETERWNVLLREKSQNESRKVKPGKQK